MPADGGLRKVMGLAGLHLRLGLANVFQCLPEIGHRYLLPRMHQRHYGFIPGTGGGIHGTLEVRQMTKAFSGLQTAGSSRPARRANHHWAARRPRKARPGLDRPLHRPVMAAAAAAHRPTTFKLPPA